MLIYSFEHEQKISLEELFSSLNVDLENSFPIDRASKWYKIYDKQIIPKKLRKKTPGLAVEETILTCR